MADTSTQNLRRKSEGELRQIMQKERDDLRDLRFSLAGAQLKNVNKIRRTKRTIARILTILNEQQKT